MPQSPASAGQPEPGRPGPDGSVGGQRPTCPAYQERLRVPWWWWFASLALGAGLGAELWLGAAGSRSWLPFALLLPAVVVGLAALGRVRVSVVGDQLHVDDAVLPVRFIADVVELDAAGRRELLGVAADPLAFVVQRPWIPGAVQVVLDDPADPTPYWLISSRCPAALTAALDRARSVTGGGSGPEAASESGPGEVRDGSAGVESRTGTGQVRL